MVQGLRGLGLATQCSMARRKGHLWVVAQAHNRARRCKWGLAWGEVWSYSQYFVRAWQKLARQRPASWARCHKQALGQQKQRECSWIKEWKKSGAFYDLIMPVMAGKKFKQNEKWSGGNLERKCDEVKRN
jgi:hypothetical protein